MARSRSAQAPVVGNTLLGLAGLALVVGAVVGWLLPRVGGPLAGAFSRPVASSGVDPVTFLGAALTTLGVIVAILIGYNVAGLQTAGQLMSLALARAMLLSLAPFLLCWTLTTGVGLVYLLMIPTAMGQLWQIVVWFAAVVLCMLSYLWTLPWRLSGAYAARWAVADLRGAPMADWESRDGYDVLQSSMAAAVQRGDLGAARAMALTLSDFLAGESDATAERENRYDRGRYRALKNLLTGCAQFSGAAPTAVAYQLGFVSAGGLLRGVATGLPIEDAETNIFSGLLRSLGDSPDRIDALWTGMRHALCRGDAHVAPYLLIYWRRHRDWAPDDPRAVRRLADGLACLHAETTAELLRALPAQQAQREAARALADLYRYLFTHLPQRITDDQSGDERARLLGLAASLTANLHALTAHASDGWSADARAILAEGYARAEAAAGG